VGQKEIQRLVQEIQRMKILRKEHGLSRRLLHGPPSLHLVPLWKVEVCGTGDYIYIYMQHFLVLLWQWIRCLAGTGIWGKRYEGPRHFLTRESLIYLLAVETM